MTDLESLIAAAREVDKRYYHHHAARDGTRHGPGGCYSSTYEPCGEHHMHDMTCGGYDRWCRKEESGPAIDALHAAIVAFDKGKTS